jgi:ribose 5-phosphate isomerase
MEEIEEVEVIDAEKQCHPVLTDQEKGILDVYDRLEELQLEIALLRAQGVLSQGGLSSSVKEKYQKAYKFR